jgi:signal transduction histidine kinase
METGPSIGKMRKNLRSQWDSQRQMLFDDRLVTVLRTRPGGETAARTQFRQLIDLLGSKPVSEEDEPQYGKILSFLHQAEQMDAEERQRLLVEPALASRNAIVMTYLAFLRLAELSASIPEEERSRILREPGLRLRNRRIVAFLASGDAKPAAAALATARLSEADWQRLIPKLPIVARGFLRHRRDLPEGAKSLLERLGVRDRVLPQPEGIAIEADNDPAPTKEQNGDGIRSLLRRIEAFREAKRGSAQAPRLPLGDLVDDGQSGPLDHFQFASDAQGQIDWAQGSIAPLVVGMKLGGQVARLEVAGTDSMRLRQPLNGTRLIIDGAEIISGEWLVDSEPSFDEAGHFNGYLGRFRRPAIAELSSANNVSPDDSVADRMRQLLHELRTPVNAIQGFAEIIQQQLFGHVPNEYRALAAGVAVDAAKLLASFDEIDRLTKLESGAMELSAGDADLRDVVLQTIQRLEGVLRNRDAGFELRMSGSPFTTGLAREELLVMIWRIFATFAGSLALRETVGVSLNSSEGEIALDLQLPSALVSLPDKFVTPVPEERPAISAGMFGTGFSFRLAQAEVRSAGGTFAFEEERLHITLPLLTDDMTPHSNEEQDERAA